MNTGTETLALTVEKLNLDEREDAKVEEDIEKFHDDDGKVPLDPIKMNRTLKWDYITKYEPWVELPKTYFPIPKFKHRPPRFVYGFGVLAKELIEYAIKMKLTPTREEVNNDIMRVANFSSYAIRYLRNTIEKEFGVSFFMRAPYSREAQVVFALWDNYCKCPPHPGPDGLIRGVERMEELLKEGGIERHPKWYISKREMFDTDSDEMFDIPADFRRYYPARTQAVSSSTHRLRC